MMTLHKGQSALIALVSLCALVGCSSESALPGGAGGGGSGGSTTSAGGSGEGGGGVAPECTPGQVVACYSGAAETEGVGVCKAGEKTCDAAGAFGPCEGETVPGAESCGNALDDDCDGKIDNGCACAAGDVVDCYSGTADTMGVGICHHGQQMCQIDGSGFGDCLGEQTPLAENCATIADESCDGEVLDEAAGCVCEPGAKQACYSGAPGTEGVGVCKGGVATCEASGQAWGPCEGEVLPSAEICSQVADEDCDGHACAEPLWAVLLGGPGDQTPVALTEDGAGNVYVLGRFDGSIVAGAVNLTSAGVSDASFLVKLSPSGEPLWGRRYGAETETSAVPTALTTDAAGNVFFSLNSPGPVNFGPGAEPAAVDENDDAYVVKLSPAGDFLWQRRLAGEGGQEILGLAAGAGGEVYVTGYDYGGVDLGDGRVSCDASTCPFAARLDGATGGTVWGKAFASTQYSNQGSAIAVDKAGDVVLVGTIYGTVDFGGGVISTQYTSVGGFHSYASHLYLAKLTSQGEHVFSSHFGSNTATRNGRLAVDAEGGIVVGGYFAGSMTLAGTYMSAGALGSSFVVGFEPTGAARWARPYVGTYTTDLGGVGAGPAGSAAVSLTALETLDLGAGPLTTQGGYDVLVGRYGADGLAQWGRQYGDAQNQKAGPIRMSPDGAVLLAAEIQGVVDFGKGPFTATGADVVVAKLAP